MNTKVHYRAHKSPPLVSVLIYMNLLRAFPPYLRSILILFSHLRLCFECVKLQTELSLQFDVI
jgi:hypothetical protein